MSMSSTQLNPSKNSPSPHCLLVLADTGAEARPRSPHTVSNLCLSVDFIPVWAFVVMFLPGIWSCPQSLGSPIQYPISNIQYPISNIQYPIITPSQSEYNEKTQTRARKKRTSMHYTSTPPLSPLRATVHLHPGLPTEHEISMCDLDFIHTRSRAAHTLMVHS